MVFQLDFKKGVKEILNDILVKRQTKDVLTDRGCQKQLIRQKKTNSYSKLLTYSQFKS